MIRMEIKQEVKDLYNNFFDTVLNFRRAQDKEISKKCSDLIYKLDRQEITLNQVILEYNQFNKTLEEQYHNKQIEDRIFLSQIESLENKLEKKELKEIRKYSKNLAKSIWRLKGINQELNILTKRLKRGY